MPTLKLTAAVLASTALLFATGCSDDPETTAGQELDKTIAEAEQNSAEAGAYSEDKVASAGQTLDDAGITAALKTRLIADDTLKALDINVDTQNGVVTMTGTAPTEAAKLIATDIAKTVDGVTSVNNELTVVN